MKVLRIVAILLAAGCGQKAAPVEEKSPEPPKLEPAVEAVSKNVIYTGISTGVPTVELVPLRPFGAAAMWGATGRDHRGAIYFALSYGEGPPTTAHLWAFDPKAGDVRNCGAAMEILEAQKLNKPGESQNKIHTKIIQANDGYLYFASMDENGENEDGSKPPTFGSHFWRLAPGTRNWEHIGECRESAIACAAGGKYVWYLSYFDHVLHQFDIGRGAFRKVKVGAVGGHVSRNFLVDHRGHAFVPRVNAAKAELIEYDTELLEVKAFPLADYARTPDASSHGIVGVAALKENAWLFTTDGGRLYRLDPSSTGSTLTDLGLIHPKGASYAACLFSTDGETQAVAVVNVNPKGEPKYEWVRFDLRLKQAVSEPLRFPEDGKNLLLYGSITRDDDGCYYIGGRYLNDGKSVPVLYRLKP